jgi:hypothetical protein
MAKVILSIEKKETLDATSLIKVFKKRPVLSKYYLRTFPTCMCIKLTNSENFAISFREFYSKKTIRFFCSFLFCVSRNFVN